MLCYSSYLFVCWSMALCLNSSVRRAFDLVNWIGSRNNHRNFLLFLFFLTPFLSLFNFVFFLRPLILLFSRFLLLFLLSRIIRRTFAAFFAHIIRSFLFF